MRIAAIHVGPHSEQRVTFERFTSAALLNQVATLQQLLNGGRHDGAPQVRWQRIARFYSETTFDNARVPTIFIVKPNEQRYWTRSLALRDGDEIAADVMLWLMSSK